MKAIIVKKYGSPDVLQLKEIEKPEPKKNEVLVKNYSSSINTVDIISRNGKAPKAIFWPASKLVGVLLRLGLGIRGPRQKISGGSFAGVIASIGDEVVDWKEGDPVYGYSASACAEYLCVPSDKIANKPSNIDFLEAGAVPGGSSPAILAMRDLGKVKKGQKVLVIGASGGIGTFAVQIAKIYGAEVTGVCGSSNIEMLKEIGADYVIDYTKEDYTTNSIKYDVIFDAVAAITLSDCRELLTDQGLYISNNPVNSPKSIWHAMFSKQFKTGTADEGSENLEQLREWIEAGELKPVIDTVYPLEKTAEAHRHYETGHSKGRVVISIDPIEEE